MQIIQKFYSPGPGNDELTSANTDDNPPKKETSVNTEEGIDNDDSKPLKTSIQEALQQWSNDDARDREEDDSTPLRSGL